tara:strand:+ start:1500 stop:1997 length:498 start_codon:yes stop_codon:yes gene_type:complete
MMIVVRTSDGLILRSGADLRLGADGVYGDGWRDRTIDPASVSIETVAALPAQFLPQQFTYLSGQFSVVDQAALDAALAKIEARKPVPTIVSMRQTRLTLLGAGLLAQIDAAIDAMSEPQRSAALIEWEYATELRRDNALVTGLGVALGLSSADMDNLFKTAAQIG